MGPISTAFSVMLPLSVVFHLFKGRKQRGIDRPEPVAISKQKTLRQQHNERSHEYTKVLPIETLDSKPIANDVDIVTNKSDNIKTDAISALRNLGMTKASATRLASQVWDQTPNDITLDDMIKRCLRALNK